MSESSRLWIPLRDSGIGYFRRIEDRLSAGLPDVFGVVNRNPFWMELKNSTKQLCRSSTFGLSKSQVYFLNNLPGFGVDTWLFTRTKSEWWLMYGSDVCYSMKRNYIEERSKGHWNQRVDWEEVKKILSNNNSA